MRKRTWIWLLIGVILCMIGWLFAEKTVLKEVPYISDETLNWDSVKQVEVYAVGCAIPPSRVITDEELVTKIVSEARKTHHYKESRDRYEGLMSHWIRFDNGVVIGVYDSVNYGYVGTELDALGTAPFYRLPLELFDLIWELAEEPVASMEVVKEIDRNAHEKYDTIDAFLETSGVTVLPYMLQNQPETSADALSESEDQMQIEDKGVLVGESYAAVNYECKIADESFDCQLGTYYFPYGDTALQQIMDGKEDLFSETEIGGQNVYDYLGVESESYHYYFTVQDQWLCVLGIERGYDSHAETILNHVGRR